MSDGSIMWQTATNAEFSITESGDLAIAYTLSLSDAGLPDVLLGMTIPSALLENLSRLLLATPTIREMLAVKPPEEGAH
jgi:hypothetical protein